MMTGFARQMIDDVTGRMRDSDEVLHVASIFLYIFLAGVILAMVMSVIGIVTYVAAHGRELLVPLADPVWAPLSSLLLGLVALGLISRGVLAVLAIIRSVGAGAALSTDNADRIETVAFYLFALQALSLVARLLGTPIGGDINGFDIGVSLSPGGLAMVLLLVVLGRVFRQGATMRDELAGTI